MNSKQPKHDPVNHPAHYTSDPSGVECITITRHRTFNIGNAIKYLWRAGLKDNAPSTQDLRKAIWYIEDEIKRLTSVDGVQSGVREAEAGVFAVRNKASLTSNGFSCAICNTHVTGNPYKANNLNVCRRCADVFDKHIDNQCPPTAGTFDPT